MKIVYALILGAVIAYSAIALAETRDENEIVWIKDSDPQMALAIKKARSTLDDFLKLYKSPEKGMADFKLKVHITDGEGHEHFWVIPFEITQTGFAGVLANEPRVVKNVSHGQHIKFTKDDISDWGYVKHGKQYGSYTVCVLLKKMPPDQAKYYRENHGFQC